MNLLVKPWRDDPPDGVEVARHINEARRAEPPRIVAPQHVDAIAHIRQGDGSKRGEVHDDAHALHTSPAADGHPADVVLHVVCCVANNNSNNK